LKTESIKEEEKIVFKIVERSLEKKWKNFFFHLFIIRVSKW